MALTPSRARRAAPVLLLLALLALLPGCSIAEDAVTSATDDAKQQAVTKAQEVAQQALTTQACELTKDGTLSAAEAEQLTRGLDVARAAGVPAEVVDAVRPLVAGGASASRAQVQELRASYCS